MRDMVANGPLRAAPEFVRYPIARMFQGGGQILLHPVLFVPLLVFLLGGSPGQIAWYAIIAGIGTGLAAPLGALVASAPAVSRTALTVMLGVVLLGTLLALVTGLAAGNVSSEALLRLSATTYLLLALPAMVVERLSEQGHEFRQSSSATPAGNLPAIVGMSVAALVLWRVFASGEAGSGAILGRLLVTGALFTAAGAWIASWPTLLALQLPHPARPLPRVRSPRLPENRPLQRYALFQLIRGISRFADPFLFVGVLALVTPSLSWIGGSAIAFAAGDAMARLIATRAYRAFNVRILFIVSGTLHAVTILTVAFASEILGASIVADRDPSQLWRNWLVVIVALTLGASYRFARTGHHAYVRSISSPGTRDLSLTVIGIIMIVTAFSPLIGVRIFEAESLSRLLQIGAGASIIALLATALIVPTYAAPRRPRGAWGMRR